MKSAPAPSERWRLAVCQNTKRLICVDGAPVEGDPAELKKAIGLGALEAARRLRRYRATTQVGR